MSADDDTGKLWVDFFASCDRPNVVCEGELKYWAETLLDRFSSTPSAPYLSLLGVMGLPVETVIDKLSGGREQIHLNSILVNNKAGRSNIEDVPSSLIINQKVNHSTSIRLIFHPEDLPVFFKLIFNEILMQPLVRVNVLSPDRLSDSDEFIFEKKDHNVVLIIGSHLLNSQGCIMVATDTYFKYVYQSSIQISAAVGHKMMCVMRQILAPAIRRGARILKNPRGEGATPLSDSNETCLKFSSFDMVLFCGYSQSNLLHFVNDMSTRALACWNNGYHNQVKGTNQNRLESYLSDLVTERLRLQLCAHSHWIPCVLSNLSVALVDRCGAGTCACGCEIEFRNESFLEKSCIILIFADNCELDITESGICVKKIGDNDIDNDNKDFQGRKCKFTADFLLHQLRALLAGDDVESLSMLWRAIGDGLSGNNLRFKYLLLRITVSIIHASLVRNVYDKQDKEENAHCTGYSEYSGISYSKVQGLINSLFTLCCNVLKEGVCSDIAVVLDVAGLLFDCAYRLTTVKNPDLELFDSTNGIEGETDRMTFEDDEDMFIRDICRHHTRCTKCMSATRTDTTHTDTTRTDGTRTHTTRTDSTRAGRSNTDSNHRTSVEVVKSDNDETEGCDMNVQSETSGPGPSRSSGHSANALQTIPLTPKIPLTPIVPTTPATPLISTMPIVPTINDSISTRDETTRTADMNEGEGDDKTRFKARFSSLLGYLREQSNLARSPLGIFLSLLNENSSHLSGNYESDKDKEVIASMIRIAEGRIYARLNAHNSS